MRARFSFFDHAYNKHGYDWEVDLPLLPRVGDEISLPGLEDGGPIYHDLNADDADNATYAIVDSLLWYIDKSDGVGCEVAIFCVIKWES